MVEKVEDGEGLARDGGLEGLGRMVQNEKETLLLGRI